MKVCTTTHGPARRVGRAIGSMILIVGLLLAARASHAEATTETLQLEGLRTGSRAPFFHRITIYDESGQAIAPGDEGAKPYSPAKTCGKCHDYGEISTGWHFNAANPKVKPGRPGEPWILSDLQTGTQIPLSYRAWPGTYQPSALGLTPWDFVQRFGRQTPGGGLGDKRPDKAKDPHARWTVSGNLEIDCLSCHSADLMRDSGEWVRQIENQNYRWAPSATIGLGAIKGEARNLPEDYDPEMPASPDQQQKPPVLTYDKNLFNANDQVHINVSRAGSAKQCYTCHTARLVGKDVPEEWQTGKDVHLAMAGLSCVDCHPNGINHATTRGDEHAGVPEDSLSASFSCKGCHLGPKGHFGAPRPRHAGLPPLHLERLTCTACHSGPKPDKQTVSVLTSMAHGLNLPELDRRLDLPPYIAEPVFVRQKDGKIGPQRAMWPAFFGRIKNKKVMPLAPEAVVKAAGAALPPAVKAEDWKPLSEAQIAGVLKALDATAKAEGDAVYVASGQLRSLDEQGKLKRSYAFGATTQPYTWPLAHDVRPASQALGAGGCTDCHDSDSKFLFGEAVAAGPAKFGRTTPTVPMYWMEKLDPSMQRLWSLSFTYRPIFKVFGFIACGVIGAVLILYALFGLARLVRLAGGRK